MIINVTTAIKPLFWQTL